MYAKTFRYRVEPEKLGEVISLVREMDTRMLSYNVAFRKYTLVRENMGEVEFLEVYLFDGWEDWRKLMEHTRGDEKLEHAWREFESVVKGVFSEDDWEVVGYF
ncbi:hypothetical protein IG193_06610 [Infirmifilum lucidum]|uniref:ABM domain-containing protein n=1 Tax=Infirmifilum lucidum TaxID=2776706 RepID=A0A7L9FGI8_9CREN|nr:hypothetical protein [Infirmifilum lucidum]QOJ78422.1 hypothetical protein IG193_06610 [Infirmifilum lucidum]